MSNILGATVRIGSGKVEYVVDSVTAEGQAFLIGEKSSRTVEISRLTIVRDAEVEHASVEAINTALNAGGLMGVWEAELVAPEGKGDILLVVDDVVTRHKSVENAAFTLSRQGRAFGHAGIIRDGEYRATRTGNLAA